ncbi:MAG: rod shape-determining protein MreD [Solirubrobacteraceae bacterium]|jgi:rod shape-determining protein MreD
MSDAVSLTLRLLALGFVACLLQCVAVSQITIFGVSADLSPLIVVSAGFLCGSLAGSVFGFGVGLFIDLAFVQTLGISSLLLTLVGYGAGRLRELRAPEAPLMPVVLGAAGTAISLVGYGVIEFVLGVNTPLSFGLLGTIVEATALNAIIALPVYAIVRRCLIGALPEDPRRRRRTYATGGLSPLSRS